jgi:nucleoside-diphosphate-sugar epimerase
MILGSGLLARAFSPLAEDGRFLVFASGVSNSTSSTPADQAREADLLAAQEGTDAQLVYFSTCSIHDPSLAGSAYVLHKQRMENMVCERFQRHLVLRLPNIVGHTPNPHTLCNHLRDHILGNHHVRIHQHACRYLMGVDQAAEACIPLLLSGLFPQATLNVCFDRPVHIPDLLHAMETLLGRQALVETVDTGSCYHVPNAEFKRFWQDNLQAPWPESGNWQEVLRKYYGIPGQYGDTAS